MSAYCGVLNIYKEKGYTSSDAVSMVRKILGRVKAGHTGTLDPQAEGVLPICVGRATKIADYIGGGKSYRAELILGVTTDTDDRTGSILTQTRVNVGPDALERAVSSFSGKSMQTPPMYSAVKIGGKKMYELARAGKTAERAPREINISRIVILGYDARTHTAIMDIDCSKGTYIRSLCADIGVALGCGGCMGALTRTRSGPFIIEDSLTLYKLREAVDEGRIDNVLHPIEDVLKYKIIAAPAQDEKAVVNGGAFRQTDDAFPDGGLVFVAIDGVISGIYERKGDWYKPRVMLTGA